MVDFERASFGPKDGSHQLISTTLAPNAVDLNKLRFLVDRPAGHVNSSVKWSPYWGCQTLESWWALWRAEGNPSASRRNMVNVEVVLVPVEKIGQLESLDELLVAVGGSLQRDMTHVHSLASSVVQYLSQHAKPAIVPGIEAGQALLQVMWPKLWPSARLGFSLRTAFAPEVITSGAAPTVVVYPNELQAMWHRHQPLSRSSNPQEPIAEWIKSSGDTQFDRMVAQNVNVLPADLAVLGKLTRISRAFGRLSSGEQPIANALTIIRTLEGLDFEMELDNRDAALLSNALSDLSAARSIEIRSTSLVKLNSIESAAQVEASLAQWVSKRLPEASDKDAAWILSNSRSVNHEKWWIRGVQSGVAKALKNRSPRWATGLWRWWQLSPQAFESMEEMLGADRGAEEWLINHAPESLSSNLSSSVKRFCGLHHWAKLFSEILKNQNLIESLRKAQEVFSDPEIVVDSITEGRADSELVAAATEMDWKPLTDVAALRTIDIPDLLESQPKTHGFFSLLASHARLGGVIPRHLLEPKDLDVIFDGVIRGEHRLITLMNQLGDVAAPGALEHVDSDKLFLVANENFISDAANHWLRSFSSNNETRLPASLEFKVQELVAMHCARLSPFDVLMLIDRLRSIEEDEFIRLIKSCNGVWREGNHEDCALILKERTWRRAARVFRSSSNDDLKLVARYASSLISWFDPAWFTPPWETFSTSMKPESTAMRKSTKMKVTFLASNPASSSPLALDEEARAIEENVNASRNRDSVSFKTKWAVRPKDLQQILLQEEPQIVHFSGHGSGEGGIVLHSSEQGEHKLIDGEVLADLFSIFSENVKVIVLNACYSDVQAQAIVKKIDCVIGMTDSVGDEAARVFAAAFYRGLAFGRSVQEAFYLGLSELKLSELGGETHIPKLLVRDGVDASTIRLT